MSKRQEQYSSGTTDRVHDADKDTRKKEQNGDPLKTTRTEAGKLQPNTSEDTAFEEKILPMSDREEKMINYREQVEEMRRKIKTLEDANSTNDDLNVRIKELQEKLESEKAKQRDLKKQMRKNKDKANKETFQWKCKYEALLTERKGSQEDTSNEDPIQIGTVQRKIVNVPDDGKKAVNKKSSKLPKMAIAEDGDENQECIVRHGNEVPEIEDRMMKNDAKKADMKEEKKRLKKENEEFRQRIKIKTEQIARIEHEIHRLKEEDDNLRMRLSAIAGSLLVNRNPTIADLSDVTRPTKLAEIFSELYDNQWTETFEEHTGSEQEVIKLLLRFLTVSTYWNHLRKAIMCLLA